MATDRWLARVAPLLVALSAFSPALAGAYRAPRTADGVPDLGGTWTNAWLTKTERLKDFTTLTIPEAQAVAYESKNAGKVNLPKDPVGQEETEWPEVGERLGRIRGTVRTSWIYEPADGKIPFTTAAKASNKAAMEAGETRFDHPEERPNGERCLASTQAGPPIRNAPDLNNLLIVQTRDAVAIVAESNQNARVVRLAGAHDPKAVLRWMGDSVGHWEGDTLVVETVNFHPGQVRTPPGVTPADTRVVERFTRTGPTELHYDFSVENPALFTQRWRGEMVFRPSRGALYEFACHEGNYALANILRGGRVAEAAPLPADTGSAGR